MLTSITPEKIVYSFRSKEEFNNSYLVKLFALDNLLNLSNYIAAPDRPIVVTMIGKHVVMRDSIFLGGKCQLTVQFVKLVTEETATRFSRSRLQTFLVREEIVVTATFVNNKLEGNYDLIWTEDGVYFMWIHTFYLEGKRTLYSLIFERQYGTIRRLDNGYLLEEYNLVDPSNAGKTGRQIQEKYGNIVYANDSTSLINAIQELIDQQINSFWTLKYYVNNHTIYFIWNEAERVWELENILLNDLSGDDKSYEFGDVIPYDSFSLAYYTQVRIYGYTFYFNNLELVAVKKDRENMVTLTHLVDTNEEENAEDIDD